MSDDGFDGVSRYLLESEFEGVDETSKVVFEGAWERAASLSSSFPVPKWRWDVVRFEVLAFLYVHVLCYAQKEGKELMADDGAGLVSGYRCFLQEVERCVRFDICTTMTVTDGDDEWDDEQVERLLENRYELYSFKVGMGLRDVVALFALLVQLSLKGGCLPYRSQEVYAAEISPVLTLEMDRAMMLFADSAMPVLMPFLTSNEFLMKTWVRMGEERNEVQRSVERFSDALRLKRGVACDQDDSGVWRGVSDTMSEDIRKEERKPKSFLEFTCRGRVIVCVIVVLSLLAAVSGRSLVWGGVALALYSGKAVVALFVPVVLRLMRKESYGVFLSVLGGIVSWVLMGGFGGFVEYELGITGVMVPGSFLSGGLTAWLSAMAYRVMRSPSRKLTDLW